MAVEIQNNPNSGGDGSAATAIIAVLVIVIIGLAIYFGFRYTSNGSNDGGVNINATLPIGSDSGGLPDGGAAY